MNYIESELVSPIANENLIDTLVKKLELLKERPYAWSLVKNDQLATKGFRSIQIRNYTVFYVIDEEHQKIVLARFLHGSRDWSNILKKDK